jgi:hypothetical protein
MNDHDRGYAEPCRLRVGESLGEARAADDEMKRTMGAMTKDGSLPASDIGSAARGLQLRVRISQRIAQGVEGLATI